MAMSMAKPRTSHNAVVVSEPPCKYPLRMPAISIAPRASSGITSVPVPRCRRSDTVDGRRVPSHISATASTHSSSTVTMMWNGVQLVMSLWKRRVISVQGSSVFVATSNISAAQSVHKKNL